LPEILGPKNQAAMAPLRIAPNPFIAVALSFDV
jgi:hypothetical protein